MIDVPHQRYSKIGLLVAAQGSNTSFTIKINYLDGTTVTDWFEADDWRQLARTGHQSEVLTNMDLAATDGTVTDLKSGLKVLAGEVVDGTFISAKALDAFLVEQVARAKGRTLIVLDTASDGGAGPLYERCGFRFAGEIPNYALKPHGGYTGTLYYYKELA